MISVIIPTFQRGNILERAYQSLAKQTFGDWELLIVDDGSSDGTEEMVKRWQENDSRIFFIKRPINRTKGPSTCRNIGMENAKGVFIAFLDSDDEWLPKRLERAWGFIKKNHSKVFYSGALVKGKKTDYMRPSREINPDESVFDFILNPSTFTQTSTLMVHREIAKNNPFEEKMTHHEDYVFFIKVSQQTNWRYFDNYDVVVHWEDNETRKINYHNCLDFFRKHKGESKNSAGRIQYLSYMVEDLVNRNGSLKELNEFKALLLEENHTLTLRHQLLFTSPMFFRIFLKLRSIIKS